MDEVPGMGSAGARTTGANRCVVTKHLKCRLSRNYPFPSPLLSDFVKRLAHRNIVDGEVSWCTLSSPLGTLSGESSEVLSSNRILKE